MNTIDNFFALVVNFNESILTQTSVRAKTVQTSGIGITLMRSPFTFIFVFYTITLIKIVAIVTNALETAGSVNAIGIGTATVHANVAFIQLVTRVTILFVARLADTFE